MSYSVGRCEPSWQIWVADFVLPLHKYMYRYLEFNLNDNLNDRPNKEQKMTRNNPVENANETPPKI